MGTLTVRALRVVLAAMLAGSLFVQVVMVPLFWQDLDDASAGVRVPVVAIVVLGIVCVQVVAAVRLAAADDGAAGHGLLRRVRSASSTSSPGR